MNMILMTMILATKICIIVFRTLCPVTMGLSTMGAGWMDVGTTIQGKQVDALDCYYLHCCGDDLYCGDDHHCYDDHADGGNAFYDLSMGALDVCLSFKTRIVGGVTLVLFLLLAIAGMDWVTR